MSLKKVLPLIGLCFIWGGYYVASQQTVKQMSVFDTGIVIRFLTMILLIVIMGARGELKQLFHVRGVLWKLLLIGCLGFALDLTAFIGLTLSSAGTGTALLKCDILFVNLISCLIYKKHFRGIEWLMTLVMLFGVFLVVGVDFRHFRVDRGSIFFILSALFVSMNAFVIKSAQLDQKNPQSDDTVAFYNNFVTMILFFITSAFMGTLGQLSRLGSSPGLLIWSILAGLGQTGIYLVYYFDLRHFPVWIVKTFLLLMPIVASLLVFFLFGDRMTASEMIGAAIVLLGGFGMLLCERGKIRKGTLLEGR
ncbi:MAG: DMT family transporter [Lachnospiraceae bacterium]|nr:DMT family transporter [Lachnospiraceae bacterium]